MKYDNRQQSLKFNDHSAVRGTSDYRLVILEQSLKFNNRREWLLTADPRKLFTVNSKTFCKQMVGNVDTFFPLFAAHGPKRMSSIHKFIILNYERSNATYFF
jgi:hypothetical protein